MRTGKQSKGKNVTKGYESDVTCEKADKSDGSDQITRNNNGRIAFHCSDSEYMMVNDYSDDDANKEVPNKLGPFKIMKDNGPFKIIKDNKGHGAHRLILKQICDEEDPLKSEMGNTISTEEVGLSSNAGVMENADSGITNDVTTSGYENNSESDENHRIIHNNRDSIVKSNSGIEEKNDDNQIPLTTNDGNGGNILTMNKGELVNKIINLSGNYLQDQSTGLVYNIDDIDVSQFKEMYVIDVPQTELHTMSMIVESEEEKEKPQDSVTKGTGQDRSMVNGSEQGNKDSENVVELEIGVMKDEDTQETESEGVVMKEDERVEDTKNEGKEKAKKKESENVAAKEVTEGNKSETGVTKEDTNKEVYEGKESETGITKEDTTKEVNEGKENDTGITKEDTKREVNEGNESETGVMKEDTNKEVNEGKENDTGITKEDTKKEVNEGSETGVTKNEETDERNIKQVDSKTKVKQWLEEEESPDSSTVKLYKKSAQVMDKPNVNRRRSESRGQYLCRLSRQFKGKKTTINGLFKLPPTPSSESTGTLSDASKSEERNDTTAPTASNLSDDTCTSSTGVVLSGNLSSDEESVL